MSTTWMASFSARKTACRRLTVTSSRKMSLSGWRPADTSSVSSRKRLPALGPRCTTSRALPEGSALLVVQRGPSAGSRFLLDTDEVSAGRHPDSDIFLDDVTVSRRHAVFRRTSDGYLVADVGSLNGTYVNRDRIDEVLLSGGDEVQIGKYRLVYFAG